MRRLRLATLLILVNLGLLVLAAAGVAWLARAALAHVDPGLLATETGFFRSLIVLGALFGLLTLLANLWLARRLSQPLQRLAHDAVRMGYGDLAAPISASSNAELE